MSATTQTRIEASFEALLPPAAHLLVCLSGGLDSTLLLTCLTRWAKGSSRKISSVHVHHGLRPEAQEDVRFCEHLASELDVTSHHTLYLDLSTKNSVQQQARIARFSAIATLAKKLGTHHVLTAHHQDDVIETMLINLTRGTGVQGLVSLHATQAPYPVAIEDANLTLLRPLISISRQELHALAKQLGLQWHEDPTNAQTHKYTRNHIRHDVLPHLLQDISNRQGILRTLDTLASQRDALKELSTLYYAKALLGQDQGTLFFDTALLQEIPNALQVMVLQTAHDTLQLQKPWHQKHFQLIAEALSQTSPITLTLPTCVAYIDRHQSIFAKTLKQGTRELDAPIKARHLSPSQDTPWVFGRFSQTPPSDSLSWSTRLSKERSYSICTRHTPGLNETLRQLGLGAFYRKRWPHVVADDTNEVVWIPGHVAPQTEHDDVLHHFILPLRAPKQAPNDHT